MDIKSLCQTYAKKLIELRRAIHQYPEIRFDLPKTSKLVADHLKSCCLIVKEKIGVCGVVADLIVDPRKSFIALRADMDAHTAMLLMAAKISSMNQENLKTNIRFLFQPSEEHPPGGPGLCELRSLLFFPHELDAIKR